MSTTDDFAVITFNGSYHSLIKKAGERYDTITFGEIVHRASAPTAHPKKHAPAIIPSSYCEYDARAHSAQREKGLFHLLCADIDKGSPSLDDVLAAVTSVLGASSLVIYSTASSSEVNMKWRVIVHLGAPLPGSEYTATASAFFDLLEQHGIECDRSLDRTGQPVYLPNVPPDRRDDALPGSPPLFYQFAINDGPPLDLTATRIPQRRASVAAEEDERDREARAAAERRHADRAASVIPGVASLIETYNANNDLKEVLGRYGYRYSRNDNWRSPLQQGTSFATKVYGNKWFSLSTSDGDVGAAAKSGGHFGDAFDLHVYYDHAGDTKAALRALGERQRQETAAALWEVRNSPQTQAAIPARIEASVTEADAGSSDTELPDCDAECSRGAVGPSGCEYNTDPSNFDEALAALVVTPDDKQARDLALSFYSQLGAIEKVLAENKLSKALGLPKLALRAAAKETASKKNGPSDLTHSEMADVLLNEYTRLSNAPVGNAGSLFFYDGSGLWKGTELKKIEIIVGRKFRTQKNAKRAGDYAGVAKVLYHSIEDDTFFTGASPGICTASGFWMEEGTEVVMVPHAMENRARHKLNLEPDFSSEPDQFLNLLRDAFDDPVNTASADEQIRLMRQFFGAALLGLQPRIQRAVFLYGAPGSGKSQVLRILEALFDPDDVTVVSPHELDQDYKKAMLAHKRLNIVPELSNDKPIPSAEFKAVLGEDRLSAREPYKVAFTFKCEAACWFNGNSMPITKDHGEAFYRRWAIIHFKNSKPEVLRDAGLFDRIASTELPKIAGWAIEGARDLLTNRLALSTAHFEQMAIWREEASSVASWLADDASESGVMKPEYADAKLGASTPLRRSEAYHQYKNWCSNANRKPHGLVAWGAEMDKLGHSVTKTVGHFVFHSLTRAGNGNTTWP